MSDAMPGASAADPFAGLPALSPMKLHERRERVFLVLAGLFLGTLTMLNLLGITRFIALVSWSETGGWQWASWGQVSFAVAVGVLPYPITFLCTDFISEFYGRRRANFVVLVGLLLNAWVITILWLGGALGTPPATDPYTGTFGSDAVTLSVERDSVNGKYKGRLSIRSQDSDQREERIFQGWAGPDGITGTIKVIDDPPDAAGKPVTIRKEGDKIVAELTVSNATVLLGQTLATNALESNAGDFAFWQVKLLTFGAVMASMIAYMAAQFCDVYLYHFWKKLTRGKHLWLRNNGSTMISQMVDTTAVILITHYYAGALPINESAPIAGQLMLFITTGYVFKFTCALLDTIPFYFGVNWLSKYLRIDPNREHHADNEEVLLAMPMGSERIVEKK